MVWMLSSKAVLVYYCPTSAVIQNNHLSNQNSFPPNQDRHRAVQNFHMNLNHNYSLEVTSCDIGAVANSVVEVLVGTVKALVGDSLHMEETRCGGFGRLSAYSFHSAPLRIPGDVPGGLVRVVVMAFPVTLLRMKILLVVVLHMVLLAFLYMTILPHAGLLHTSLLVVIPPFVDMDYNIHPVAVVFASVQAGQVWLAERIEFVEAIDVVVAVIASLAGDLVVVTLVVLAEMLEMGFQRSYCV